MLGLVELFTGHPRAATVVASGPLQLQVLAPEAWTELCENGHPAVFNIERASIRRLGDRLRHYVDGIAERTRGSVLELQPARTGLLERLSKSLRPPAAPSVQALEILQGSDLFSWAAPTVLEAIAARCDRQVFEEGHALCSQGEDAKCMWVVAKGEVDQVIRLEGGRVETLATLKPGDAFGDESMALGSARTLSYVAREGGVALAIGRERYLEFFSVDDAAGSVFRQGMCRNMVRQLMAAQKRFVQLASLEAPEEEMIHGTPVSTVWRD